MGDTILVPVDFSDCSLDVARQAGRAARERGAVVILLHVVELPPSMSPDTLIEPEPDAAPITALAYVRGAAEARMAAFAALDEFAGLRLETHILRGIPAEVIVEEAARVDATELFMGTHGRTGFAKLMNGSVAESVMDATKRPVTVVRSEHKSSCQALSCAWCTSGALEAQDRLWTELDR